MLKRLSLYFSGASLRIVLFFGITLVCFALIATNPSHVKNLINDTDVYQEIVPALINDTIEKQPQITLPLQDKQIQQSINSSFTADSIKKNSEIFIDGTYSWLNGDSQTPQFKVDFTQERQQTAVKIAAIAFERVKTLPVCFAVPETLDPFTVGCQPPLTNLANEEKNLSNLIAGDSGILPKAVYTEKDLPKNNQGEYIYEKYSYAPTIYAWLRYSPFIVLALTLGLSILVVALSRTKREGFIRLGTIFLGSGFTLIITPLLLSFIVPAFSSSVRFSESTTTTTSGLTNKIVNSITNDFYLLLLNISIQVIVIGLIILLAERITRPKSKYANASLDSGLVTSIAKKPSQAGKYKPSEIPILSSEESTRRKPKKTHNKKYRKIPGKGDNK
jgi:hypothetical protein